MNQRRPEQTDIEQVIKKVVDIYGEGYTLDEESSTTLKDFVFNYMYYLLAEADQVAEFDQSHNIDGSHVRMAIKVLNERTKTISKSEIRDTISLFDNAKTHNLNPDESKLISYRRSQESG